jgi:hypothetical protein
VNFHNICIQNIGCQRHYCHFFLFLIFQYFVHFDVPFIHYFLFSQVLYHYNNCHVYGHVSCQERRQETLLDCMIYRMSYSVPFVLLVGKACMISNLQLPYWTSCRVVTYDVKQYSCEDIRGHWTERPLDGSRVWCARQSLERNCDYVEGYVSEISYWSKIGVSKSLIVK